MSRIVICASPSSRWTLTAFGGIATVQKTPSGYGSMPGL
jgi:hypothetical protein